MEVEIIIQKIEWHDSDTMFTIFGDRVNIYKDKGESFFFNPSLYENYYIYGIVKLEKDYPFEVDEEDIYWSKENPDNSIIEEKLKELYIELKPEIPKKFIITEFEYEGDKLVSENTYYADRDSY